MTTSRPDDGGAARSAVATPLSLTGALPSGTVVLEASAGTGKTYAIAALATRAVAEGTCELPQLLIVTFTRAATAELRERVRRRLVGAEQHLRRLLAGQTSDPGDDEVLRHLGAAAPDELTRRHARLTRAVTDFDAATISTIHGFTQQVLRSVGLAADVPRDLTLLEDSSRLIEEVVDDVYLRRYLGRAATPARPTRAQLRTLADLLSRHPDAQVRPEVDGLVAGEDDGLVAGEVDGLVAGEDDGAGGGDGPDAHDVAAAELVACAAELRAALADRKRRDGSASYDDLLHALRRALRHPERGPQARAVLRERYRWALIDEFQDTDPVQWDILRAAFADPDDPGRALVLIGDPKQAIYSFRGADVRAYLTAVEAADRRHELGTNFRSDGPLLGALDRMLDDVRFGEDDIRFRRVVPAPAHRDVRVGDDRDPAALQLRPVVPATSISVPEARTRIARDLAATLLDQLDRVRLGTDGATLRPEHVAVLVRTNDEARLVQATLREVDVPSVVNGVGSVLETAAADDWAWLLEAVERPSDPRRIRRLALSCWIGWRAAELGDMDDDDLDALHDAAARWGAVLADHGVATFERTVLTERRVAPRLLGGVGGERHLTDVRHLGRLLHVAERDEDRGVSSLRAWLASARAEARRSSTPPDEQARRLESDARAVQILTVHRAKGLQYPLVCVPYAWGQGQGITFPVTVHDPDVGGRILDVGPAARGDAEAVRDAAKREQLGEQLRLLYVAVTRAQHRAIVWSAPTDKVAASALGRVLFREPDGRCDLDAATRTLPDDVVGELRTRFDGTSTSVAPVTDDDPLADVDPWRDGSLPAQALTAARFDRRLDRAWRRTSYTGWTRAAALGGDGHTRAAVSSEPEATGTQDEPTDDAVLDTAGDLADMARDDGAGADGSGADGPGADGSGADGLGAALPLGELRGGPAFGVLVHAVLEHTDLAAGDLPGELTRVLSDQRPRHRVPGLRDADVTTLVDGLTAAIHTPLGPATVGPDGAPLRLADLPRADRLDELDFELPLAGGDRGAPGGPAVTLAAIADLLDRPAAAGGLPDDDPFRRLDYAQRLRSPGAHRDVRGYLNGSIDLVIRRTGPDGQPRFLVADHKTNRLGGATPTVAAYAPEALTHAMVEHDYPLQALLYQVALHRFLRWRHPGYDPDRHLGGALYLFLRGMTGPEVPHVDGHPCGVVTWSVPGALVADLSDLLAGTTATTGQTGTTGTTAAGATTAEATP